MNKMNVTGRKGFVVLKCAPKLWQGIGIMTFKNFWIHPLHFLHLLVLHHNNLRIVICPEDGKYLGPHYRVRNRARLATTLMKSKQTRSVNKEKWGWRIPAKKHCTAENLAASQHLWNICKRLQKLTFSTFLNNNGIINNSISNIGCLVGVVQFPV